MLHFLVLVSDKPENAAVALFPIHLRQWQLPVFYPDRRTVHKFPELATVAVVKVQSKVLTQIPLVQGAIWASDRLSFDRDYQAQTATCA